MNRCKVGSWERYYETNLMWAERCSIFQAILLYFWAVQEVGMSLSDLTRRFEMNGPEVVYEVERGKLLPAIVTTYYSVYRNS